MSPAARRELEDMSGAETVKEPVAVGNELERLELNSGALLSYVDEDAKPGHDNPGSCTEEVCTSQTESARQPSAVHLSDVSYAKCSISGIYEAPGVTDGTILTEECSENRDQKYNQKRKGSVSHSLFMNSPGSRMSKSLPDTSHVEQKSKLIRRYRTRIVESPEDTECNVPADVQGFNYKKIPFSVSHVQYVGRTEPTPSRFSSPNDAASTGRMSVADTTVCDVLDHSASAGIQHSSQPMYIDPRLPNGWTRSVVQRKKGASAGRFDVYIFSPDGKKFRSQRELKSFLLRTDLFLNADHFDFSVNGKGVTVEGQLGLNETTVQNSSLVDEQQVSAEIPLEFNSENFQDKTKDLWYKNVPKMQEDSEYEFAEKLIQPCSHSLNPNVRRSRRVTSAYFASHRVSKRISNGLHDSHIRNNKLKGVQNSTSGQAEPKLLYKRTDNEGTDEIVPVQFDDSILQTNDSDSVCKPVSCVKNMLKSTINTKWTPPRSPFNLVQEHLYHDPWQLLVATVFLNRTQGEVALPSLFKFFAAWPTPESIINASQLDIAQFLRPLGLQETRAYAIKRMSQDFVTKKWTDVKELFGIGKYGSDSHKIFCVNQWKSVRPTDQKLKKYVKWLWTNHRSLGLC